MDKKKEAHRIVAKAIHARKLTRQPCEVCGDTRRVHAHHDDYDKPLDVRWLCECHHREAHGKKVNTEAILKHLAARRQRGLNMASHFKTRLEPPTRSMG